MVQKNSRSYRRLIGNKTADRITSIEETKSNENEGESNKKQKSYIPPEKDNK